jgi:hypothetical protein
LAARLQDQKVMFRYPIALNQLALMEYSTLWDIDTILVFEKLMVMYNLKGCKPIFYQGQRLERDLHIGRGRIEKARDILSRMGILIEESGRKNIKMYSFNCDCVIQQLPVIYKMPEDENQKLILLHELGEFYNFFLRKGRGRARFQITGIVSNSENSGDSNDVDYSISPDQSL